MLFLASSIFLTSQATEMKIVSAAICVIYLVVIIVLIVVYIKLQRQLKALPKNFRRIKKRFEILFNVMLFSYIVNFILILAFKVIFQNEAYEQSTTLVEGLL
jgi:NADH:ubiquinone oxidoreductase subunit 6 (subunit J)